MKQRFLFNVFLGYLILSSAVAHSQSIRTPHVVHPDRKVIGVNNFKIVDAAALNIPYKLRGITEAVGLMSMACTGTHIGYGLVISAGHCFEALKKTQYKKSCNDVTVSWGLRTGKNPTSVSRCRQILVLEDSRQKDYALFLVDNPPKFSVKVKMEGRASLGTHITLFSHPFNQPLMWSGICEIKRVASSAANLNFIHHWCDTNPGSSGAGLIDVNTLELVGIHNGGYSSDAGKTGVNYGTYIDLTYIPTVLSRMGYR